MALRDTRHIRFNDSLLGTTESSLSCGPVHFDCFPNFTVGLHNPYIMKVLTLNVKTRSQISTPCYTAKQDSVVDQDEDNTSQKLPSQSGTDMEDPFQQEHEIDHQLMVIRKEFTPDLVALGKEFDLEKNRVKREAYRANHTREQKKEVLEKWKEFMKEISSNVPFFEYFENHFEWHKKSCVITKTN